MFSANNISKVQEWHVGFSEPSLAFIKTYATHPNVAFNFDNHDGFFDSNYLPKFYLSSVDKDFNPQIAVYTTALHGNDNFMTLIPFTSHAKNASIILSGMELREMDSDLILGSTEKGLEIFIIYRQAKLTFLSYITDPTKKQEKTNVVVHILNDLDQMCFNITFRLTTFNTQLKIATKPNKKLVTDLISLNQSTNNTSFHVHSKQHFDGTILFYDLVPNKRNDGNYVYLKSEIAFHNSSEYLTADIKIVDMTKNKHAIFMQGENAIIKVDPVTQKECNMSLEVLEDINCKIIEAIEGTNYTISGCYLTQNDINYLYLVGINHTRNCTFAPLFPPNQTILTSAESMKIVDNILFILETQKGSNRIAYSRIHVYNLTKISEPEYYGYIDQLNFDVNSMDSKAFQVAKASKDTWRLFIVDSIIGVRSVLFSSEGFSDYIKKDFSKCTGFHKLQLPANIIWTGVALVQKTGE